MYSLHALYIDGFDPQFLQVFSPASYYGAHHTFNSELE